MKQKKKKPIENENDFSRSVVRRSIIQGTGIDMDELKGKPVIGIANSRTDINPGHMNLSSIGQRVKAGVLDGGGIPFEFNVPAPCDGITDTHEGMRFVLAQRDLIADSIETHVRSMQYDGIIFIAGCDKIIPGMIMAAARLDIPAIFITGGPGSKNGRHKSGRKGSMEFNSDTESLDKLAAATCSTCGSCEFMGTASTFQCLTEALGLSIPGSANIPAFHSNKLLYSWKTGKRMVEMVKEKLTVRKILTSKSIENGIMVDMAIGGSVNLTLHLPAIAHELGMELPLEIFNDYNKKIPTLCGITPNGSHRIIDLYRAGGIPAVMKMLASDLHLDALNVTGGTIAEVVEEAQVLDKNVIPDKSNAFLPEGGTVILKGNLAPEGAVVKQSAIAKNMRLFTGKARVFNSEADCLKAIRDKKIKNYDVIIIRYEGPKGGPGMPETLAVTMGLELSNVKKFAIITDGRFSGAATGPCVGHVSPEAYVGGPIAIVRNGDEILIDIAKRKLDINLTDEEMMKRFENWKPVQREIPNGFMRRYVRYVSSAAKGAILE